MSEPTPSRLISPTLLLVAVVWLLASWVVNAWLDSARLFVMVDGSPQSAVALAPAARGLLISMAIGGMLIWPAWRLSQPSPRFAGPLVGADLVSLVLLVQVVVWPLRVGVWWGLSQAAMISLTLVLWLLAAGLLVWAGWLGRTAMSRTVAMGGCLALLFGGPVVGALTGWLAAAGFTPIAMLWRLARPDRGAVVPDLRPELLTLMIVIAIGWALLLHLRSRLRAKPRDVKMD